MNNTSTPEQQDSKTCPFCAETVKAAAIKCKHCGEMLDGTKPQPIPAQTQAEMCPKCNQGRIVSERDKTSSLVPLVLGAISIFAGIFMFFVMSKGTGYHPDKSNYQIIAVVLVVAGLAFVFFRPTKQVRRCTNCKATFS